MGTRYLGPMQRIFRQLILIGRVAAGSIFVAHGWQKLVVNGIPNTQHSFARMGIPSPELTAYYATSVELVAGVALIIGLFLPLAGLLLASDMLGAFAFVHDKHGIFVQQGGFELVAALGILALLLGFSGGGTLALDHVLFRYGDRQLLQRAR
jgi:putative oxidoreductase